MINFIQTKYVNDFKNNETFYIYISDWNNTCPFHKFFRCDDGTCIYAMTICDGFPDCPDASEESPDLCSKYNFYNVTNSHNR